MTETSATPRQAVAGGGSQPLEGRGLRLVMLVLAFAGGASVANLYYAQPLLGLIRDSFAVSGGTAALVVTLTQVGYAAGLALLLPLGDLLENRKLASRTLLVTAVALAAAAAAPSFGVFLVAVALVGVTSVVAQVLVPLAAHLAPPQSQGKYVGQVMGGLLLGIMLARSVASLAAAAGGWGRSYVLSAGVMVLTALVLGSPGGSTIITTVANDLISVVDNGLDIQQAADAPRFHHQYLPDVLQFEKSFPVGVVNAMKATGYTTKREAEFDEKSAGVWGDSELIARDPKTGELTGGQDKRHHFGKAAGY